jgi:hypothetical protein
MDIEENTIGHQDAEVKEYWESRTGQPYGGTEADPEPTPVMIYSLGFDAVEVLTVYAGLRTYLKALAGRENEDLEQIHSATNLLIALRPQAVKASKALSLKAAGMEGADAGTK